MIVAVADDADAMAQLERVMQEPLERSPGGMHFNRAFEPAVMGGSEIGIAAADVRDHHGVLALERAEKLIGGVDRVGRGLAFHQNMRGAVNRTTFVAVEHVAVTAHAGIARPLIARQANETPRHVELRREPVELAPERIGDLEIITLVADHVDEGGIAGIAEIVFGRSHANGFTALPMQIAPVAPQWSGRHDPHGIGAGELFAIGHHLQVEIAGNVGDQIFQNEWAVAGFAGDDFGQAAQRLRRHQPEHRIGLRRRVAPHVLRQDRKAERLAGDDQ